MLDANRIIFHCVVKIKKFQKYSHFFGGGGGDVSEGASNDKGLDLGFPEEPQPFLKPHSLTHQVYKNLPSCLRLAFLLLFVKIPDLDTVLT